MSSFVDTDIYVVSIVSMGLGWDDAQEKRLLKNLGDP